MRNRNLIILALIVVALGAYIYFHERHLPTTEERRAKADTLFPDLKRDEVVGLEIRNTHGTFRIVKRGERWHLGPAALVSRNVLYACRCGDATRGCNEQCDDGQQRKRRRLQSGLPGGVALQLAETTSNRPEFSGHLIA